MNDELVGAIEKIADEHSPDVAISALAEVREISRDDAREVVEEILPTTDGPGRHSMQYCLLCNPHWNGAYGKDGTEAIGKYKVEDIPGVNQFSTGWHGVCTDCIEHNQSIKDSAVPLDGHEGHPAFDTDDVPPHECVDPDWEKESLVTEADGMYDWVRCTECGYWAKRYGVGGRIEEIAPEKP